MGEPTRDELYKDYIIRDMGLKSLGRKWGHGDRYIRKLLVYHGIPVRNEGLSSHGPECEEKKRQAMLDYWAGLPPEVQVKRTEGMNAPGVVGVRLRAYGLGLTVPERRMMGIIETFDLPFSYGGNGRYVVDNLKPDFISTNQTKMVILIDGYPWHEDPFVELDKDKVYRSNGYKVIHFTDRELRELDDIYVAAMIMLEIGKL